MYDTGPTVSVRAFGDITYPYGDCLPQNGVLERGCGLKSQNRLISLTLTLHGNLFLINEANGMLLWSILRKDISFIMMRSDGQCVAHASNGKEVWVIKCDSRAHPYQLVCQNDGNLVIYGSQPYWISGTSDKIMGWRIQKESADKPNQKNAMQSEMLKLFTADSMSKEALKAKEDFDVNRSIGDSDVAVSRTAERSKMKGTV